MLFRSVKLEPEGGSETGGVGDEGKEHGVQDWGFGGEFAKSCGAGGREVETRSPPLTSRDAEPTLSKWADAARPKYERYTKRHGGTKSNE